MRGAFRRLEREKPESRIGMFEDASDFRPMYEGCASRLGMDDMPSTFHYSIARKRSLSIFLRVAICVIGSAGVTQAFADRGAAQPDAHSATKELPERKPGLWRITTISPQIGMHVGEACVEEGDSIMGTLGDGCRADVARANDQAIVTIACGDETGREVTSILFTGDFRNWYRGQSKTTFSDREGRQARHSGFTIDARYLRESCRP